MKLRSLDLRLISGLVLAHLLLFFSFQDRTIFWYIFAASSLLLIIFSMFQKEVDDEVAFFPYLLLGIISGLILYGIFWLGHQGITAFHLPFQTSINRLYRWFAPTGFFDYLALILVAAPSEELFWRGFIQKRLLRYCKPMIGILLGAVLYASAQIYSGEFLLVFASFLSGFVWGLLYFWKRSMPLVIVSHIIFDIMLFIILPLR